MARRIFAVSLMLLVAACAAPADEEETFEAEGSALSDQPSVEPTGTKPLVLEYQAPAAPLNLELPKDWSLAQVDVLQDVDRKPTWIRAEKLDEPRFVSGLRDTIQNGVGSGPCRLRLGLKKVMVQCKWRF